MAYRGLVAADACPGLCGVSSRGTGLCVTTRNCRDISAHSFSRSHLSVGLYGRSAHTHVGKGRMASRGIHAGYLSRFPQLFSLAQAEGSCCASCSHLLLHTAPATITAALGAPGSHAPAVRPALQGLRDNPVSTGAHRSVQPSACRLSCKSLLSGHASCSGAALIQPRYSSRVAARTAA